MRAFFLVCGAFFFGVTGCGAPEVTVDAGTDGGRDAGTAAADLGVDARVAPDLGPPCRDSDGDGSGPTTCGGTDCDDSNSGVYAGATELCDRVDQDCDPRTLGSTDADGDQRISMACCNPQPSGDQLCGDDCDDTRSATYPGALEVCDLVDNDCNGVVDEGAKTTFYADVDGDQFGVTSQTTEACMRPVGYASVGGDCLDTDVMVYPSAPERCNDADDNCNAQSDEGLTTLPYSPDCDGDGFGDAMATQIVRCGAPAMSPPCGVRWVTNNTDCDDTRPSVNPGNGESCDSLDNNCNGVVDEGPNGTSLQMPCYADMDEDGRAPMGATRTGTCTTRCPRFTTATEPTMPNNTDCNDTNAAVADLVAGRRDGDADGVGNADVMDCPTAANFIPGATGARDCDDGNPSIKPGQTAFFATPTGRGCPDAVYNIRCPGGATCGRLRSSCCPPITLPTCTTTDVIPQVDLWNYDCDPLPTGPPTSAMCASCGACNGGFRYTSTAQCGTPVEYDTCTSTCSLVGPKFCILQGTDMRPLTCR